MSPVEEIKKRVQVLFTTKAASELESLQTELGCSSSAEVIRRAVRLLQLVTQAMKDGKDVVLVKPGEDPEKIVFL